MLESGSTPDYASEEDYKSLPADLQDEECRCPTPTRARHWDTPNPRSVRPSQNSMVPLLDNIYWKELSVLLYVWVAFLIVQIIK
ncbi:membrane protein, partial [Trifolium medium]|nr:membrane protein [Trifolium medium]